MATIKIKIKNPEQMFNDHIYRVLFDYDHPAEVHYGGASSGKSHGVVQKVVFKALKNWDTPRKILFLRKFGSTIRQSIFADVKACLDNLQLLDMCKVNNTNFEILLPNNSLFTFQGLDDPEKVKSIHSISDIVMEEASEFTLDDYTQLTLRLRDPRHKKRQIFLMFNPVSKANWTYQTFFKRRPEGAVVYHTSYKDNKFLDEDNIKNIEGLAEVNPSYYKVYALGHFATLDKLIFPKYTTALLSKEELAHLPSYFGLDFGYTNDPSAFVHVKVDLANRRLYILEEYVKKGLLNHQIAEVIKSLGYKKERITADSAEQKSVAELRHHGINRAIGARKGGGSVLQGIQLIQSFDIIVDERCTETIHELDNYTWQKDRKTSEYINTPVDDFNHVIDAIRYALESLVYKDEDQGDKLKILRKLR